MSRRLTLGRMFGATSGPISRNAGDWLIPRNDTASGRSSGLIEGRMTSILGAAPAPVDGDIQGHGPPSPGRFRKLPAENAQSGQGAPPPGVPRPRG